MFKFNDENIFIGYIKQLLASFNLPKYRVYTKEQRKYHEDYLRNKTNYEQAYTSIKLEIEELQAALGSDLSDEEKIIVKKKIRELETKRLKMPHNPELNVLISTYRNDTPEYTSDPETNDIVTYPTYMRYIPYIKDGDIQIYSPKIVDGVVKYSDND